MRKFFTLLLLSSAFFGNGQDFESSPLLDVNRGELHTAGDFDGDGFVDIVTGFWNFTSKANLFFYKNEKTNPVSYTKSNLESQLALVSLSRPIDYDQDGDLDIIYASSTDNTLFAYDNDGKGKFTSKSLAVKGTTVHSAADMNGDNILDIVGHHPDNYAVMVYTRDASGAFTNKTVNINGFKVAQHRLADTDNDGDTDIILSAVSFDDQIIIMVNDGKNNYTLTKAQRDGFNSYDRITIGDLNKDGLIDIIGNSQSSVMVLTNKGGNKFNAEVKIDFDSDVSWNGIETGDLNGDGKLDIISGGRSRGLFWYKNVSTSLEPKFEKVKISDITGHNRLSILDMDNDKDLDIITNNNFLFWISNKVKQETSSISAERPVNISLYPNPVSHEVIIDGLEGDGHSALIYNAGGLPVLKADVISNRIDVRSLNAGMYILQLQDQSGNVVASKHLVIL
jgi:hypothetical protein